MNTRIHDDIHANSVRHDFAKRRIKHDITLLILLINNTTFNIKTKLQRTVYEDLLDTQKKCFYKITKYCALYQTVIYVDIHNNQCTNL